jgi:hypothetical protein
MKLSFTAPRKAEFTAKGFVFRIVNDKEYNFSYLYNVLLHISLTILCLERSFQFLGKYQNVNVESNGKFIVLLGDFAI